MCVCGWMSGFMCVYLSLYVYVCAWGLACWMMMLYCLFHSPSPHPHNLPNKSYLWFYWFSNDFYFRFVFPMKIANFSWNFSHRREILAVEWFWWKWFNCHERFWQQNETKKNVIFNDWEIAHDANDVVFGCQTNVWVKRTRWKEIHFPCLCIRGKPVTAGWSTINPGNCLPNATNEGARWGNEKSKAETAKQHQQRQPKRIEAKWKKNEKY